MELKDMKITREGGQEESVIIAMSEAMDVDAERYPYGLRLSLDGNALDKLGVKAGSFEPGKTFKLVAKAEVESVSVRKESRKSGTAGTSSSHVELQITEMGLERLDDFGEAFAEATGE